MCGMRSMRRNGSTGFVEFVTIERQLIFATSMMAFRMSSGL